jgi:two-component system KDP operon response regulator KdpE
MSIDLDSRYIVSLGKKQKLTPTERDLLKILLNSVDRSATYQELAMRFWGRYDQRAKESLAVHVTSLRKKNENLMRCPVRSRIYPESVGRWLSLRAA